MSKKTAAHKVKVGQIWRDNDKRSLGRKLRVQDIANGYAMCRELIGGRAARIRLDRFKPNSTGYVLVDDVP